MRASVHAAVRLRALFWVCGVVAFLTEGATVADVVLQLREYLARFDVVRDGCHDGQPILVHTAEAFAFLAQAAGFADDLIPPEPVTLAVIMRIAGPVITLLVWWCLQSPPTGGSPARIIRS